MDHRLLLLPAIALVASAPAQATVYFSVAAAQAAMFGDTAMTAQNVTLTPEQIAAITKDSGVAVASPTLQAWKAADGGWFFVDAVIGKSELITYALALTPEGRIKQVEVLEYREAHGEEVRYPRWRRQFYGKQHGNAVKLDDDIQGISGATLSCQHLTDGIRRLLATYAVALAPV